MLIWLFVYKTGKDILKLNVLSLLVEVVQMNAEDRMNQGAVC